MSPCTGGDRRRALRHTASSGAHVDEGVVDQNKFIEVEFIGEPLAFGLMEDPLVVVVSESPAQLVVVHLGFTLPGPPQPGHLIRVLDDELAVVPLPGDDVMVLFFPEQLQDEVPQLDLSGPGARLRLVSPFWEGDPAVSRCFHFSALATLAGRLKLGSNRMNSTQLLVERKVSLSASSSPSSSQSGKLGEDTRQTF